MIRGLGFDKVVRYTIHKGKIHKDDSGKEFIYANDIKNALNHLSIQITKASTKEDMQEAIRTYFPYFLVKNKGVGDELLELLETQDDWINTNQLKELSKVNNIRNNWDTIKYHLEVLALNKKILKRTQGIKTYWRKV